jgi:hypothetical protein
MDYWKWFWRYRILKPHLIIRGMYWWVQHRTFKRFHVIKIRTLKPGYYDVDDRMLHGCFQLLVDYVEKEKPFENTDWKWSQEVVDVAKEIRALYQWWKEVRPARKDPLRELKDEERPKAFECYSRQTDGSLVYGDKERQLEDTRYPKYKPALEEHRRLELSWDDEDREMLIRLMKIRLHLWT